MMVLAKLMKGEKKGPRLSSLGLQNGEVATSEEHVLGQVGKAVGTTHLSVLLLDGATQL